MCVLTKNLYFQLQNRRTHYQDQMVLTSHNFAAKAETGDYKKRGRGSEDTASGKATSGLSQLVLIVNNWGFVRDTQHDSKVRPCTVSDFQVQLKLSSSAFRNALNPDCQYPFDKQAANFPYDSFEQILKSNLTKSFVAEVKGLYEDTEGPIASDNDNSDTELDEPDLAGKVVQSDDEEDRALAAVLSKARAKRAKK